MKINVVDHPQTKELYRTKSHEVLQYTGKIVKLQLSSQPQSKDNRANLSILAILEPLDTSIFSHLTPKFEECQEHPILNILGEG